MSLPEIERRTIARLADEWKISPTDLEDYLATGKLIASIKLPPTMLHVMDLEAEYDEDKEVYFDVPIETEMFEGVFKIYKYDRIVWDAQDSCDLFKNKVRMSRHFEGDPFPEELEFADSYLIRKNDIFIERDSIKEFLDECDNDLTPPVGLSPLHQNMQQGNVQPYLNNKEEFFSNQLETAVLAWMAIYNSGRLDKKRGHTAQLKEWIKDYSQKKGYRFNPTTITRITQLINYNGKGGHPSVDRYNYK